MNPGEAFELGIKYERNLKEIHERFVEIVLNRYGSDMIGLFERRKNLGDIQNLYLDLGKIPEECLNPDRKKVIADLGDRIQKESSELTILENRVHVENEEFD